jgi:hypothetical protein
VHVSVLPGLAHLSPTPFSSHGGFAWGGWRRNRVFVGKVDYGVKTVLWTKKNHLLFTKSFRVCASAVSCEAGERAERAQRRSALLRR